MKEYQRAFKIDFKQISHQRQLCYDGFFRKAVLSYSI